MCFFAADSLNLLPQKLQSTYSSFEKISEDGALACYDSPSAPG
jgi:hypothetical protein